MGNAVQSIYSSMQTHKNENDLTQAVHDSVDVQMAKLRKKLAEEQDALMIKADQVKALEEQLNAQRIDFNACIQQQSATVVSTAAVSSMESTLQPFSLFNRKAQEETTQVQMALLDRLAEIKEGAGALTADLTTTIALNDADHQPLQLGKGN
jgi:hypothetical protein